MRKGMLLLLLLLCGMTARGQRFTDVVDRGVVAVPGNGGGYLVSWRVFGEEYYDVKYNVYRNGTKLNASPLSASNYLDSGGSATSQYQVSAVVDGVEQAKSAAVKPWTSGYYDIKVQPVYARGGSDVTTSHSYIINDISLADVNGDGVAEFIVKRLNGLDYTSLDNDSCFNLIECYTLAGQRLWWIDCGPNLVSGSNVELNAVAYDWDEDGKAEVIMRGADNMIIHQADGTTYEVGDMTADTRWSGMEYTTSGKEYLLYLNGETGAPYQVMDFPLPRYDSGETQDEASIWGKGIQGHRPNKFFFGAPFLDGRKASVFLSRGIYTRIKMVALDVDPSTHALSERWRWKCYDSSSAWYGQGYHNYAIADVDWDGRDEIVYGSMVIDDNGKGLSTTGLGHGDAQHCGDLDPYRWGLEQFACNESQPNMNFRNATTSEIYYRSVGTSDDGRALCANFTNDYPGCVGRSVSTGMISTVADKEISAISDLVSWGDLNYRIYWDGDLLDEVLNSPGIEREAKIEKPGTGRIFTSSGCQMCNWSKNSPCAQGDIIGDWREEIVLRANSNTAIRIYTSPYATEYRNYTLWHDHQYRQAMVWQMCGYNQPPHVSYFLGEMEGITVAPPPLTMTGREEIANGGTISTSHAKQHVIVCETNDTKISVSEGANPKIATFNVPSWVQGNDNNKNITYDYYTCTVTGGAFSGTMRLVKQGEGTLILPDVDEQYTGNTDVWGGTLQFGGTLKNSALWLNRFATLVSDGGTFRSIKADYASKIIPGGADKQGVITTDSLLLGFGSRVVLDIYGETQEADQVNAKYVSVEKKDWTYGPAYLQPVMEFVTHTGSADSLATGRYLLGEIGTLSGSLDNIKLEGLPKTQSCKLVEEDGKLYLEVSGIRAADYIIWNGLVNSNWDFASTANFTLASDLEDTDEIFVSYDKVKFDDTANTFSVDLTDDLEPDSVIVDATKAYTFKGNGTIAGDAAFVKTGTGTITMGNDNTYTGGNYLKGGTVKVSSLSNANLAYGNLGAVTAAANKFTMENGAVLQNTATVTMGSPMKMVGEDGGVLNCSSTFNMNRAISGTVLTKKGSGWLTLYTACSSLNKLVIAAGTVQPSGHAVPAKTVEFQGGTLSETQGSAMPIVVPDGKTGTWNLVERGTFSNTLTGAGTLTVYIPALTNYEGTARTPITGNWSAFTGTVKATTYSNNVAFTFNNSYGLAKGTLDIQDGRTVCNGSGKTFAIGKVTGSSGKLGGVITFSQSAASGICTWKVGNDDNWSWAGQITGSCAFTKVGSGKVSLTNKTSHDFTGACRVEEGELHISSGVTLGTGTLTVVKGAMLSGITGTSGNLINSSTSVNGTLQVGINASATSGIINFNNKNVTFTATSRLEVGAKKGATATTTGGGSLGNINKITMNGTVAVNVPESHSFAEGDSIILWTATTCAGTPKLENYVIDEAAGLYWDDSNIQNGVLYVTTQVPTGIGAISADEQVSVTVLTTAGAAVGNYETTLDGVLSQFQRMSLPRGTYVLRIQGERGTTAKKVQK